MIEPPRLGRERLLLDAAEFGNDRELENGTLEDFSWSGLAAHRASLHRVRITRADMISLDMRQGGFVDMQLEHGVLSGMIAVESLWRRVLVKSSRADGMVAYSSQFFDVQIQSTRMDQANLRSGRMRNVDFIGCSLREVDFAGASLRNVSFDDCDITGADFTGAKMKNVDLRHARFEFLNGFSGLRGALMTYQQVIQLAPILARQAGIIIDENESA